MISVKGMGQIDPLGIPEEGTPGFNNYDPMYPGSVDTSGAGVNTPGTSMGGSGASGVLSILNTVIQDGAAVARVALTPTARIAGPYGISTIPMGSVTPSGLNLGGGFGVGGISPVLLLGGLGLLVVLMMAGRRS